MCRVGSVNLQKNQDQEKIRDSFVIQNNDVFEPASFYMTAPGSYPLAPTKKRFYFVQKIVADATLE